VSKLKNKTVESKYIVSFIFKLSAIIFVGFGIFGLLIIIFLNRKIGPTYLEGISTLSQLRASLPLILSITASVQAATLCIIAVFAALLWSHSIAGPLVRFKRALIDLAQGKSLKEPIAFRDDDQLHGLANAFSEMAVADIDNRARALTLMVEAQRILDECEALKKQAKFDAHALSSKVNELEKIYLRIKDIYAAKKSNL